MTARQLYPLLVALLLSHTTVAAHGAPATRAVIYTAYAPCPGCDPTSDPFLRYINELVTALHELGVTDVRVRNIQMDPQAGADLDRLYESLGVPGGMRGSFVVSIDGRFLFIDHVPVEIIADFLANHAGEYGRIVVSRDAFRELYVVMDEGGQIKECRIERSVTECVERRGLASPIPGSILALILVSGLLDGINPCAFAVLLFFVAFLFITSKASLERARRRILLVGSIYVIGVYIAYLMIGLGIIRVIAATPFHRLAGKVGALIVVLLGAVNIKDYFWYGRGVSLRMPASRWMVIRRWMRKSTVPSAFVMGLLVGVFEFPCTGGIYVAILGMLARNTTFAQGFVYLLIYNAAFVLPLIAVLAVASRRRVAEFSLERWQRRKGKRMRLMSGVVMVALGVFLLFSGLV